MRQIMVSTGGEAVLAALLTIASRNFDPLYGYFEVPSKTQLRLSPGRTRGSDMLDNQRKGERRCPRFAAFLRLSRELLTESSEVEIMAEPARQVSTYGKLAEVESIAPTTLNAERVPVVIGITGHRELNFDDLDNLKSAAGKVLAKIKSKRNPETPLVLLSPLAEGADRVVAHAALALGIHLVVPLPMPREEYERDFPHSLDEFRAFLRRAHHVFELPLVMGNTRDNIQNPANRDLQYKAVGQYIARHSQELIALWDGHGGDEDGGCGTAAVVRYKREGVDHLLQFACDAALAPVPSGRNLLEPTECGPVHHIWTRRRGRELTDGVLFETETLYPHAFGGSSHAAKYYGAIFSRIDHFNLDVATAHPELETLFHTQRESLIPEASRDKLASHELAILERYRVADSLAVRLQTRLKRTQRRVHLYVFIGSFFFGAFAHLPEVVFKFDTTKEHLVAKAITYLFLVIVALAYGYAFKLYRENKKDQCQDRYQDYRALAEGLRVQFFWRLAGIEESVVNHYFGKHRTELDWIRNAIRNWSTTTARGHHEGRENFLGLVLEYWVEEQHKYFKSRKDRHKQEQLEKWVNRFLWSAVILGSVMLSAFVLGYVLLLAKQPEFDHLIGEARDYVILLTGTFLVAAGLLHHYKEQMAYSEHEKQYSRMALMFGSAEDLIRRALSRQHEEKAKELMRDTGINALEENGDWVMLHRERPLEIPAAG